MSEPFDAMLATLEAQLESARRHAEKMRNALRESEAWALEEDRRWIADATAESEQMCADAEERLAAGRRIVGRTVRAVPKERDA